MTTDILVSHTFSSLLRENDHDFAQTLPNEILIQLFELVLDDMNDTSDTLQSIINLSLVCETWRQIIISTPLLWPHLDLSSAGSGNEDVVDSVNTLSEQKLFAGLRHLILDGWNGDRVQQVVNSIAINCGTNLRHISLKSCVKLSELTLQTVANHCPNIESLDLSSLVRQSSALFTRPLFRTFLQSCGNKLLTLNISNNELRSAHDCISIILELCPNLQCLDISNLFGIPAPRISISHLQNVCPQLRVLRAANVEFVASHSSKALPGFASLHELSIPTRDTDWQFKQNHPNSVYTQLTKSAHNLVILNISGAPYLSANDLVKIPTRNLQCLSINNCPRLQDDRLGEALVVSNWNQSLVDIDLSFNKSESSVSSCLRAFYTIGDNSRLTNIQLRDSAVCFSELKQLILMCKKLVSIDLHACKALPRGIKRSYTGSEFQRFREQVARGKYD